MSGCDSDTSNPDGGVNPGGSTGGGTRNCTTCTITSQTAVTVPADRTRTTIGVGEDVYLTCSEGGVTWTVSGEAVLSGTSGASVTLRAGRNAGSVTATATGPCCTCSITFTVIAPASTFMDRSPGYFLKHHHGRPDCGFFGQFFLRPDTVSFKNLEVREKNSHCTANGFYLPFNNCTHQPATQTESGWFTMSDCRAGQGTPANLNDKIYSGDTGKPGPPFEIGTMTFPIDWEYRVWGGSATALPHFQQQHQVDAAGQCSTSKGGTTESRVPGDPDGHPWPDEP
ncbi:MAG: hypothetical protein ABSH05_23940 [Bryobacteraceae bacterium]|jgi:hypothetical protein